MSKPLTEDDVVALHDLIVAKDAARDRYWAIREAIEAVEGTIDHNTHPIVAPVRDALGKMIEQLEARLGQWTTN